MADVKSQRRRRIIFEILLLHTMILIKIIKLSRIKCQITNATKLMHFLSNLAILTSSKDLFYALQIFSRYDWREDQSSGLSPLVSSHEK